MDTDEIVELGALRRWLEVLAEASYQGSGYRRVKNPRIWSLHDLPSASLRTGAVLTAGAELGQLEQLGRRTLVRVPAGAHRREPGRRAAAARAGRRGELTCTSRGTSPRTTMPSWPAPSRPTRSRRW
jgi:hypothetical protein